MVKGVDRGGSAQSGGWVQRWHRHVEDSDRLGLSCVWWKIPSDILGHTSPGETYPLAAFQPSLAHPLPPPRGHHRSL